MKTKLRGSGFYLSCLLAILLLLTTESCRSRKKKRRTLQFKGREVTVRVASSQQAPARVRKAIETARTYKGTPHRDGGLNKNGIDCSGLMLVSFNAAEYTLPRRAAQQAETGKEINLAEIKPGDLVFFSDKKVGQGITHVGLVTELTPEGKLLFIHTSSSLGVVESNLLDSYWQKTYVKARRVW